MRELLCPTCSRANAVKDKVDMHAVRCAECDGPLDDQIHVRYLVDDVGGVKGPRIFRDLVKGAVSGALSGDALLSEEGGPWFLAEEREDIFRSQPPRRAATANAVRIPAPVLWMASLAGILGGLLLLVGILAGAFLADLAGRGEARTAVVVFAALGLVHIWMSFALRRGSRAARFVQLGLATVAGLGVLSGVARGADLLFTLIALAFVSVPFFLLLNKEARAYFRAMGAGSRMRGTRKRATPNGGMRGRKV